MQGDTTRDEQLLDELLGVADALAADMAAFLARHGLTPTKAHVLWSLRRAGARMQRRLAEELGYSPRHVTTLIDDLVAQDLVERADHPHDRRAVLVRLTPAGEGLVATFESGRAELAHQLFGHVDAESGSALMATLRGVSDRLAAAQEAALSTGNPTRDT